MPTNAHPDTPSPTQPYHYLGGLIAGVFSFAALNLVFLRLGVQPIETIICASLGALVVGILVFRERFMAYQLAVAEREFLSQLSLEAERLDELYSNAVTSLVMFDAGTLVIDRVSSGLLNQLGVSIDKDLTDARLDEVLNVDPIRLANVVDQIKAGSISVREELECKRADGKSVSLFISGRYLPHLHVVEAAFSLLPQKPTELADYQRVMDDLERFQKGIVRRESRVLELKGEVNELLRQQKQSVRYQVDANSDDSRFMQTTLKTKKAVQHR